MSYFVQGTERASRNGLPSENRRQDFERGARPPIQINLTAMQRVIEAAGLRLVFDDDGTAAVYFATVAQKEQSQSHYWMTKLSIREQRRLHATPIARRRCDARRARCRRAWSAPLQRRHPVSSLPCGPSRLHNFTILDTTRIQLLLYQYARCKIRQTLVISKRSYIFFPTRDLPPARTGCRRRDR
jgi:hypothetical protein